MVSTFTKIETTRALLDATTAVLRQTSQKGFSEMELKKFKSYLAGQFAIQVQSPEALAAELANIAFYRLPTDYLQTYLYRLRGVTLSEANRIASSYFRPGTLSLVLVAPASKIRSQLTALIAATGSDAFEERSVDTVGK